MNKLLKLLLSSIVILPTQVNSMNIQISNLQQINDIFSSNRGCQYIFDHGSEGVMKFFSESDKKNIKFVGKDKNLVNELNQYSDDIKNHLNIMAAFKILSNSTEGKPITFRDIHDKNGLLESLWNIIDTGVLE